jgi:MFS transporter, putative metabolite:H+ symporter
MIEGKASVSASGAAAEIMARIDRLPSCRAIWRLVVLLSFGGFFEIYDLFQTAYLSPGLIAAGIFRTGSKGLFGLSDQAGFAAATFAGLFIGTIAFASVADRFGRRSIFTFSLLWYTVCSVCMGVQHTNVGVDAWRLIAGIGIGVELVTIDAYISELAPRAIRGRAFAVNQSIQFVAIPLLALVSYWLVPRAPFGVAGWRWVVFLGALAAVAVWWIRRSVPESPRWLAQQGRIEEAGRVVAEIEARIEAEIGRPLPQPAVVAAQAPPGTGELREIWAPAYRTRTIMLVIFNFFQTIGFYGFGNWVPALMVARGINITNSLKYAAVVSLMYPIGPLICMWIADEVERKWQIVAAAMGTATFGLLFGQRTEPAWLISFGLLITFSNNMLSYAYHAYQAELYPTRIRARAVGFVYSWSRLSTIFTSFLIGFFLDRFGTGGVLSFIAASMLVVMLSIGVLGPLTKSLPLEAISH